MVIKRLTLHNFRGFSERTVDFTSPVTAVTGPNAAGKTTVAEAVYMFARGRSFRSSSDAELIKFGETDGWISVVFAKSPPTRPRIRETARASGVGGFLGRLLSVGKSVSDASKAPSGIRFPEYQPSPGDLQMTIRLDCSSGRLVKSFYREREKLPGASAALGEFRAVLFCPEHLSLVQGPAEGRRAFMDQAIAQYYRPYVDALSKATEARRNRSQLLKQAREGMISRDALYAQLKPWNELCAESFSFVTGCRSEYIRELNAPFSIFSRAMAGDFSEQTRLCFVSDLSRGKSYEQLLTANIEAEIAAAHTLWGPQHDDFFLLLGGKSALGGEDFLDARKYASQGQQRTLVIALKLAEGEISYRHTGDYPVYILDDVMSELDVSRRAYILSGLDGSSAGRPERQVIITTAAPEQLNEGAEKLVQIVVSS